MLKAFGQRAKMVNQRMQELKAANNLEVVRQIPAADCHMLKGNREGEFAVKISANFRLIFIADHDTLPKSEKGGIEWILITDIQMLEVEDYH